MEVITNQHKVWSRVRGTEKKNITMEVGWQQTKAAQGCRPKLRYNYKDGRRRRIQEGIHTYSRTHTNHSVGYAPMDVHVFYTVQCDIDSFVPEMMGTMKACTGFLFWRASNWHSWSPSTEYASVRFILARWNSYICRENMRKYPHRKLCDAFITSLHESTKPKVLPKFKACRVHPLDEQADTKARKRIWSCDPQCP